MYELYAYPNTYAMGVHLLLQESGVPYRVIDVRENGALEESSVNHMDSSAARFHTISPHRRVPAVRLPDGTSLCESGAIALHLADTLREGQFSIPGDHPDRAEYLQWMFYLCSTLQPEVMLQFHPEYYFDKHETQNALKAASLQRLAEIWSILETRYQDGPWIFDNRPTAVDFSLVPALIWPESFPSQTERYPNLQKTLAAIWSREACNEVIRWHQRETTMTGRPAVATLTQ